MTGPEIVWDQGTVYDLFISLEVLHHPADFNVRAVWAAGVRARIPAAYRKVLEQSLLMFYVPYSLIARLPQPHDANSLLWYLEQMPARERLPLLVEQPSWPEKYAGILHGVMEHGKWEEREREALKAVHQGPCNNEPGKKIPSDLELEIILDWWKRPEEFGERYLEALYAYCEVFFNQEERRLRPALQAAINQAKVRAEQLTLVDLLEELTQGVRFEDMHSDGQVTLAASYWSTPLVYFMELDAQHAVYVYGARPLDVSLAPGEQAPDSLIKVLEALSDPTRLKILRYLAEQPQTPTLLANRLGLRTPTVTHHLKVLRLAGLVRLTLGEEGVTKYYEARPEGVGAAYAALNRYLKVGGEDPSLGLG
jgi:DNA-binding transcriptional ArsR family regulator